MILAMAGMVSIPILFARTSIGNLFTDSPEVTNLVATAIIPLIIYQFGDGMQCTYANALRGISHVKPLAIIAFISYFLISLPLGYLLGIRLHYGLVGIWSAFPFGLTTAGILYYLSFQKKFRQERFQDFAEGKGPSTEIC
jgi:MATE family multidrug resistance protein